MFGRKRLVVIITAFLLMLSLNLLGQGVLLSDEVINLKQNLPKTNLDFSTRRIGEGQLQQMEVTFIEIQPRGQVAAHKHLAEEMIYIVSGEGYTLMWSQEGDKRERYNWTKGDMLSPGLNVWHQHVNTSPDTTTQYLSLTSAPLTYNLFHNAAFLSSSDHIFEDRWKQSISKQAEYAPSEFQGPSVVRMQIGHHISNLPGREMRERREGVLGITVLPEGDMAGNNIMEWEVREYQSKNASSPGHRHPWETVYYIMDGSGFALLQRNGEPQRRVNWQEGDLILVEADEFHEFHPLNNSSPRLWQVKASGYFHNVGNLGIEE